MRTSAVRITTVRKKMRRRRAWRGVRVPASAVALLVKLSAESWRASRAGSFGVGSEFIFNPKSKWSLVDGAGGIVALGECLVRCSQLRRVRFVVLGACRGDIT